MIAASTTALGYPATCVGTNFAYRKKVYREVGGFGRFKSFISGDDDLFLTLVREKHKYTIQYAADADSKVYNNPPRSFSQFVNQRLRFASKGFDYPPKVTLALSLYVIFNLMIPLGVILGFLGSTNILLSTLIIICAKNFFEYKYLRKAARVLSDLRFSSYYFITAILHLPYVLFFGIFGQFKIFKWAENKAEHGVLKKAEY
jgi:cellulose synthase/poly-beta-1,6-N-acetylglucosamine synthase-like glycosyltransferase